MANLEDAAGIYGASLTIFAEQKKLPRNLFDLPDHIVLRAADIEDFGRLVREEVIPRSRQASCAETDWRFKVAAKLFGRVALYDLGFIEWVAVEEPRIGAGIIGLERAEFYCDSLETARTVLGARGIRSRITPEKERAYINVQFDSKGQEFRLTDTPLSEIAEGQIDSGDAVLVQLAKKVA